MFLVNKERDRKMNVFDYNEFKVKFKRGVVKYDRGNECFVFRLKNLEDKMSGMDFDEYKRLEKECEGKEGIIWSLNYGDEVISDLGLRLLSDFDNVKGLEEFVLKYVE